MFLDTIYEEDFHNFLKNPTDSILSGTVMNENEKGYYYRFVRVPMADGEHSVEALFGQMCSNYPPSMSKDHFSEQHNLEFMAYVVDHEKTYAESYEFLRLFDVTSAYTGPHSAMEEMTKTLWDYLEQKTILDPDYLNTPELQNEAYESAINQYVLQKKDVEFEKNLRQFFGYFEYIDDTATIEFFANPTGWAERVVNVLDKNLTSHDGTPFSESIGKKFVAVQHLTQLKMLEFQSKPHCWESECRSLFAATVKAKNIRLVIEANGKEMQLQYPVSNLITFEMIKEKVISAWAIAPRKLGDEVKKFLAENCADYSKYRSDIPMKAVSRIESGRKVLWKNPVFVRDGDRADTFIISTKQESREERRQKVPDKLTAEERELLGV